MNAINPIRFGFIDLTRSMEQSLHKINSSMSIFNRTALTVFAGAGYAVGKFTSDAVKDFATFEREHSRTMGAIITNYGNFVDANAKATDSYKKFLKDSAQLKADAIKIGGAGPDGRGSLMGPTGVAQINTWVAKAGVQKPKDIAQYRDAILKYSVAADVAPENAATQATNIANMFKVPVGKVSEMLDKIVRASDLSTIEPANIMDTLKYVGPIAAGLKGSYTENPKGFDELLAAISLFGNQGLDGSMAGTGIRALYMRTATMSQLTAKQMKGGVSKKANKAYNDILKTAIDKDGNLTDMQSLSNVLDEQFMGLNDVEQSWVTKKLYGLMRLQTPYALAAGAGNSANGGMSLEQIENSITTGSAGNIQMKYDLALSTSDGQMMAAKNALDSLQMGVGDALSPTTKALAQEFRKLMLDPKGYNVDFNAIRSALGVSSGNLTASYGAGLGTAVNQFGNAGINLIQAGVPSSSIIKGAGSAVYRMLNGDFGGALEVFNGGIKDSSEAISKLPPELQGLATGVRNVTTAFFALSATNIGLNIAEKMLTIFNATFGKLMTIGANTVYLSGKTIVDGGGKVPGSGTGGGGGTGTKASTTRGTVSQSTPVQWNTNTLGGTTAGGSYGWTSKDGRFVITPTGSGQYELHDTSDGKKRNYNTLSGARGAATKTANTVTTTPVVPAPSQTSRVVSGAEKWTNRAAGVAAVWGILQSLGINDQIINALPENTRSTASNINTGIGVASSAAMMNAMLGNPIAGLFGGSLAAGSIAAPLAAAAAPLMLGAVYKAIGDSNYTRTRAEVKTSSDSMKEVYGGMTFEDWAKVDSENAQKIVDAINGKSNKPTSDKVQTINAGAPAPLKEQLDKKMYEELGGLSGKYKGVAMDKKGMFYYRQDEFAIRDKYLKEYYAKTRPDKAINPEGYRTSVNEEKAAREALMREVFAGYNIKNDWLAGMYVEAPFYDTNMANGGDLGWGSKSNKYFLNKILGGSDLGAVDDKTMAKLFGQVDDKGNPVTFDVGKEKQAWDAMSDDQRNAYAASMSQDPAKVYGWTNMMYKTKYGQDLSYTDFMMYIWNDPSKRGGINRSGTYNQRYPNGLKSDGTTAQKIFNWGDPNYAPYGTPYWYFDPSTVQSSISGGIPSYVTSNPNYAPPPVQDPNVLGMYNKSFMNKNYNPDGSTKSGVQLNVNSGNDKLSASVDNLASKIDKGLSPTINVPPGNYTVKVTVTGIPGAEADATINPDKTPNPESRFSGKSGSW